MGKLFLTQQLSPPLGGWPPPVGGGQGAFLPKQNPFRGKVEKRPGNIKTKQNYDF
jgi:hypothetical protein